MSKRQWVYRIEDSEGDGMYWSEDAIARDLDLYELDGRHPPPHKDAILSSIWPALDDGSHKFGFTSLEQLKCWVFSKGARQQLADAGFTIAVFEAEAYAGDTQVIYVPETRVDLDTLSLTDI